MASAETQIELLHSFLAEHPRPAGVAVSAHLQRCAAAGYLVARRVLASGLFTSAGCDAEAPELPAAIVSPAVQERQRRIATQQLPARVDGPEPARRIVSSAETRPWLPK